MHIACLPAVVALAVWMTPNAAPARSGGSNTAEFLILAEANPPRDSTIPKPRKRPANPASRPQIACTHAGCIPVPRGCWIEIERNFDGIPTGYDAIVCPYR